jgi:hypothetical protein
MGTYLLMLILQMVKQPIDKHQHILKDEIIQLKSKVSKEKHNKSLRRVSVWDDENKQVIELITNQFN